ncbi:MAG: hypothetical protein JW723_15265 [Bacteroidales bacterium]|nr:hypothetical protein [Bacteroidales bacterium]
MADVIFNEIASKGQKALIYSGIHHAFTKYNQPYYDFDKDTLYGFNSKRMGNILYDSLGNKTFTIYLHAAWTSNKGWDKPMVKPVNGMIDEVMESFTDKRVGFDVVDSPFGQLPANDTYYAFGYPDFNLAAFCDGYIYQNSFKYYEPITMEKNFITEENINELKDYYRCIKLSERYIKSVTVKNADKKLKEDVRRLIRHLM